MAMIRQTILIRTDLGLKPGLNCSQCSHLHFERYRQILLGKIEKNHADVEWLETPYTFIHGVPNPEVLNYFIGLAQADGIEVVTWRDTIYSQIDPDMPEIVLKDCLVGATFGPCDTDRIKAIIGRLPLLP